MAIGIRELKNKLSAVLKDVENGETVDVTDRGRVVAHIIPHRVRAGSDRLDELVARGLAKPPTRSMKDVPWSLLAGMPKNPGLARQLIDEDRGD